MFLCLPLCDWVTLLWWCLLWNTPRSQSSRINKASPRLCSRCRWTKQQNHRRKKGKREEFTFVSVNTLSDHYKSVPGATSLQLPATSRWQTLCGPLWLKPSLKNLIQPWLQTSNPVSRSDTTLPRLFMQIHVWKQTHTHRGQLSLSSDTVVE